MKVLNKLAITVAAVAVSGVAGAANIVGAQSAGDGGQHITVQESNVPFGPHTSGKAGISVSGTGFLWMDTVDFAGLTQSSKTDSTSSNGTTVYQLHDPIPDQGNHWWEVHKNLGSFSFVKVGSGDVWIGEWSRNGQNDFAGRQVYYVGEHGGTTMPSGGTATYTTYGINKFTGNNLLTGTLTADFNSHKLTGSIQNSAITLTLKNTNIAPDTASFSGKAKIDDNLGNVQGHFFGNQAAALAGIAEFDNKDLNTAFGGTKN